MYIFSFAGHGVPSATHNNHEAVVVWVSHVAKPSRRSALVSYNNRLMISSYLLI